MAILKKALIGASLLLSLSVSSCDWDDYVHDDELEPEYVHFVVGIWDLVREDMVESYYVNTYETDLETDYFVEFLANGDFRTYRSYSMDDYYGLVTLTRQSDKGVWDTDDETRTLYMYYDNGLETVWHYDPTVRDRLELRTYEVDQYGHVLDHQVFEKVYFERDSVHMVHF